ncbi:MAG TPA: WD40 repeat domain-containing protein [Anaerolineales bacterium]|nr:WD40 repeat domain-containing protein [Anaerolineales bacterium]
MEGYFALAFSPNGNWLVSGGSDSFVRMTRRDGTIKYQVKHEDWVEDVAFGPDPSWYVSVSDDNKVRVLDTETGREKLRMAHANYAQRVQVSPDGQWIASTGTDRMVRIWDAASGDEMLQIPLEASGCAISFNQDGTRIVIGEREGNISIWDISSLASRLGYIAFPEYAHEARMTPSGKYLIVNTDDYKIWKIPAESITRMRNGTEGEVIFTAKSLTYYTAISPDSKWVAAVEYDNNPQRNRGDLVSLDGKKQFPLQHGSELKGVAFDNESKFVVTAGSNGFITFWDVNTGEKQFDLVNSEAVNSLAFNPSGGMLAAGLHNRTRIWDVNTLQPVADLTQIGNIVSAAFSQDGKWLATGSSENTVVLWKAEGMSFEQSGATLNLSGIPQVLAFSPDGKWLVSGSTSGFANIWDVATGQETARIPHGERVNGVSFSPDGTQLFTVSRKMVRIWNVSAIPLVPKEQLVSSACSHLVKNLSQDEWTNLFGSETYHLICPNLP